MSVVVDWLVGDADVPTGGYAYTINGTGYGIAAGTYYLYDATGSRSMLQQLKDDMTTEGLANPDVFFDQAGRVRITSDDSFTIVWSDPEPRDFFGFTATTGPTTAVSASLYSPLFWSPGYRGTPVLSPAGVVGSKRYDTKHTVSPSGQTGQATTHNTTIEQIYRWNGVYIDRVWTTDKDGLGGEFRRFYDDVLRKGRRFKLYPAITEDRTSTTAASMTTALGPYKIRRNRDHWYSRMIDSADLRTMIEIQCYQTAEAS